MMTSSNWGHHVVEYPVVSSCYIGVYGSSWEYVEMIPLATISTSLSHGIVTEEAFQCIAELLH